MLGLDFLHALENKIVSSAINLAGDELVVKPRDSPIKDITIPLFVPPDEALTLCGYVNLSDFTDIWTKVIMNSIRGNEFNFSESFIIMMGLEASLRWKGFPRRTAVFANNPRLYELKKRVSSLRVKDDLVATLNGNSILSGLVKKVKPRRIDVELTDSTSLVKPRRGERIESVEAFLSYIRDPNEIVWKIEVNAELLDSTGRIIDQVKIENALDLMNFVSKEVVKVVRELEINGFRT